MRLGEFITREMETILAAWEAFAATRLPAAERMGSLELRDHAPQILEAIVADLSTPQPGEEQPAKSMGLASIPFPARETAAQAHAVLRARGGFDVKQVASEYRALREGGTAFIHGTCVGDAVNEGGVIEVFGVVTGKLDQSRGTTVVHADAVITRMD